MNCKCQKDMFEASLLHYRLIDFSHGITHKEKARDNEREIHHCDLIFLLLSRTTSSYMHCWKSGQTWQITETSALQSLVADNIGPNHIIKAISSNSFLCLAKIFWTGPLGSCCPRCWNGKPVKYPRGQEFLKLGISQKELTQRQKQFIQSTWQQQNKVSSIFIIIQCFYWGVIKLENIYNLQHYYKVQLFIFSFPSGPTHPWNIMSWGQVLLFCFFFCFLSCLCFVIKT